MVEAVITGVASTRLGKLEGSSVMGLHADAALGALADMPRRSRWRRYCVES